MGSKKNKIELKINKKRIIRIILITFFLFFVSYYDPFGVDQTLSKHSNNLFYHVFSPWFDNINDDKITVILLRENELEERWPPSYEYHADVLTTILENEPKAIFIDLLFESTNGLEVSYLREVLLQTNKHKNEKIPVYLAMGRDEHLSNAFLETFFNPDNENPIPYIHIDNVSPYKKPKQLQHIYPTSIVINSKQAIRYPLTNLPYEQLKQKVYNSKYSGRMLLSLPAQLYCNDKYNITVDTPVDTPVETLNTKKCVKSFIEEHDSQDFYITWRDLFSETSGSPLSNQCVELSSSVIVRTFKLLLLNVSNGLKAIFAYKPTPPEKQKCLPHQTLSMTHLFKDPDRKTIKKLINGKYVFYGVKLENTNDIISPPTHEALPGIYAHTMALENYLTYDDMIVDDHQETILGVLSVKIIWSLIICFTLAIINEVFRFIYVKKSHKIKHLKKEWKNEQKKASFTKWLQPVVLPSITIVYLVVIVCWIILTAMILPFQLFDIAPLSGFDFAVAIGFINLPNIFSWFHKKLDKFGLGESFNT